MTTAVIIVAAGRGNRAGGEIAKQWQMLGGRPVLAHGLAAFANLPVVLVIHPEDRARAAALVSFNTALSWFSTSARSRFLPISESVANTTG